jgi:GNAT superfamily N-acetyltransferase
VSEALAVRPRQPPDAAACVALLRQVHEHDGYPLIWPADPAAWLYRPGQLGAWVAERAAGLCGHVAIARPEPGAAADAWAGYLGRPASELVCVSLLFAGPRARGTGVGGSLLRTALDEIRYRGGAPVLEVVSLNSGAVALYRARGWREVGSVRYDWLPPHARCLLYVAPPVLPA